jgi:hypothetical protein
MSAEQPEKQLAPVKKAPAKKPESKQWTSEELTELRESIKAEVLAEMKALRVGENSRISEAMVGSVAATHKGSQQPGAPTGNPLALPEVPEGTVLPDLVHFTGDGFTINNQVTYRGQEYVPTKHDAWALLDPHQQILTYGEVKFRPGPWEGLPFDLNDPVLTDEDRTKLEAVMRDRYAQRVTAPLPE